jgi:flagellar L-ring protein precursor FlgH
MELRFQMPTAARTDWNLIWLIGGLCLLLSVPRAAGQNNSMFGGNQTAAPPANEATQGGGQSGANPATPQQPVVAMQTSPPVVAARQQPITPPESAKNPLILRISPIAVAAPEPRKIKVNDLITIIVRQSKSALSDSTLESAKEWKIKSELTKFFRLSPNDHLIPQNFAEGTPGIDFDFDNSYDGSGRADRRDEFTTRVSATVIDVKPNGNLVLEAKNRMKIDEEEQIITLTGTCRTDDISPQNTVLSTQLADLEIVSENTGAVRDASRRGWLMRLFDLTRPL